MIELTFPGITGEQFEDAFNVLRECINTPSHGFMFPYMGPGGQYGHCWWERDSSLTLNGYCWLDQKFCEDALKNFTYVQKPNGRIPLWGNDRVGNLDEQLSAIPVIFDVARRVAGRTGDREYIEKIYGMLAAYLDWWLSPCKCDRATGLVCGIMEETDPADHEEQLTFAEVDLNVQVCAGADILREFAAYLGLKDDEQKYFRIFCELRDIINRHLYDEETGFYYTRNVKENRLMTERPYNSAFDTFRRGIVPKDRIPALLSVLKDNSKYGYYNRYGITTAPFDSPEFCETTGDYKGWTSWSGNIWTLRNEIIAKGLHESGLRREAAHIAYQTVMTFNGNYAEFVNPSDGSGQGVRRYGWTASEYIELIIEEIFGINYDAWTDTLTVTPNIPEELYGHTISIRNVSLGDGRTLDVTVDCAEEPRVEYIVRGKKAE
jgi:glycogen debranching enzyme